MKIRRLLLPIAAIIVIGLAVLPAPNVVSPVIPAQAQNGCGPEGFGGLVPDLWFTSACNRHDICYGTCGASRSACDSQFYNDMRAVCAGRSWYSRPACYASAWTYYQAVRSFGGSAFSSAQASCR